MEDDNREKKSSEDQVRQVQRSVHEMDEAAGNMEDRGDELRSEIDSVRQEFQRRRSDANVPGLPHEPETDGEAPARTRSSGEDEE